MATLTEEQKEQLIAAICTGLSRYERTPVFRRPSDLGLAYDDIYFPSLDNVPLEGWFIPCKHSQNLVICNHFGGSNRYGFPGHLEPWKSSPYGGEEVNFLPKYKALHEAGYNVIAYDMRNHGLSGEGSAGLMMAGMREYRDVVGSIRFAKSFEKTKDMNISLQSLCMGCNATLVAMTKHPEDFKTIVSLIAIQPLGGTISAKQALKMCGIGDADGLERFDAALRKTSGLVTADIDMQPYAKAVNVPTLLMQVHDDPTTTPEDIESIFANIKSAEKELFWINDSKRRYDAYQFFSNNPAKMIEWYNKWHAK